MNYLCHSLILSCAGCNHPATHTHKKKTGQMEAGDNCHDSAAMLRSNPMSSHQCRHTRRVCTLLAEIPWVFPCPCIDSHSKWHCLQASGVVLPWPYSLRREGRGPRCTRRIVFSDHHGEAACTRCTALCSARITVILLCPDSIAGCAHDRVDRIWEAEVTCQGRVPVRLLIRTYGRYSLVARVELMRGAPYRKCRVSVSAEGCADVQLCPPPNVICVPRARRLCFRQSPMHVAAPESPQSHRTSNFQISDRRSQTSWTRVVRVPRAMLVANSTLSRNCAKLKHIVPLHQYTYPSSDTLSEPRSLSLFPPFFTPHRVCRSALWAEIGPPIGMLILCSTVPQQCATHYYGAVRTSALAPSGRAVVPKTFHSLPPPSCPV